MIGSKFRDQLQVITLLKLSKIGATETSVGISHVRVKEEYNRENRLITFVDIIAWSGQWAIVRCKCGSILNWANYFRRVRHDRAGARLVVKIGRHISRGVTRLITRIITGLIISSTWSSAWADTRDENLITVNSPGRPIPKLATIHLIRSLNCSIRNMQDTFEIRVILVLWYLNLVAE